MGYFTVTTTALALALCVSLPAAGAASSEQVVESELERPVRHRLQIGSPFPFCVFGYHSYIPCGFVGAGARFDYVYKFNKWVGLGAFLEAGFPHIAGTGPKFRVQLHPEYVYLEVGGHVGDVIYHWLVYGLDTTLGFDIPLRKARRTWFNIAVQAPVLFSEYGLHGFVRLSFGFTFGR
jgi:hypothetical protein